MIMCGDWAGCWPRLGIEPSSFGVGVQQGYTTPVSTTDASTRVAFTIYDKIATELRALGSTPDTGSTHGD